MQRDIEYYLNDPNSSITRGRYIMSLARVKFRLILVSTAKL